MVREWAVRFRDEARERSRAAPNRPDQLGALLPGRRGPLERLPQPAGRDDQRVAAGDDQRRLRRILGRDLLAANRIDHADGETGSAARLLRQTTTHISWRWRWCRCSTSSATRNCPATAADTGRGGGKNRGRRCVHHHAGQHLLPHDLPQGGRTDMTRTPGGTGTPGVTREFVGMDSPTARRAGAGGHPCQGIYHRGVGRKPKVAMIATHYQIDFSEHYLADYMATRGIGFLGWNTRYPRLREQLPARSRAGRHRCRCALAA